MNLFYKDIFKKTEGITVFSEPSEDLFSNHWLSCIQIDHTVCDWTSEKIRLTMDAKNIESRPLWKPMHLQPVFKDAPYYGEKEAESLFHSGLCLPSGSNLTSDNKERVFDVLKEMR